LDRIDYNPSVYYRFEAWPDLTHGIFTRLGGVSQHPYDSLNVGGLRGDDVAAVRQNHAIMYDALGVNGERACTVWMVHSADVVIVNGPVPHRRWLALADGMITDRPDTPLVMRYADCTPLFYRDRRRGVIGIAHAGWRGTVQGVASRTVRAMTQAYGCDPADVEVGIGPSIGPARYQVGQEVVDAVQAYFGTTDGLVRYDADDGTAYLNLWEANRLDLERAGVEKIEISGLCTAENTHEFYSHRAEKGQTGRFGAVIAL
jgi:hypothetical protein